MAHGFYDTQNANPGTKTISGSFAPAGTGAITTVLGKGFSAARTNTGEITITFRQKYYKLLAAKGCVQLASAADMAVQFGAYDPAARTLILRTQAGATPTDISADANNRVSFEVTFQATSAPAT